MPPRRQSKTARNRAAGRLSTVPPERRPPVRQHCPLLRRNRRVGDRRSARGCLHWRQCRDVPRAAPPS